MSSSRELSVSSVDQAATHGFLDCDMQQPYPVLLKGQDRNCDRRNDRNKQRYGLTSNVLQINAPDVLIGFHAGSSSKHDRHDA